MLCYASAIAITCNIGYLLICRYSTNIFGYNEIYNSHCIILQIICQIKYPRPRPFNTRAQVHCTFVWVCLSTLELPMNELLRDAIDPVVCQCQTDATCDVDSQSNHTHRYFTPTRHTKPQHNTVAYPYGYNTKFIIEIEFRNVSGLKRNLL